VVVVFVEDSVTGDMVPIFGRFARGEFGNDGGKWVVSLADGGGVVSLVMVGETIMASRLNCRQSERTAKRRVSLSPTASVI
jgi:hypothetical protein